MQKEFVRNQTRKYDIWASVHHNCVAHLRHTHEYCVVSGVYYVKTPKETGKLLLHDPRGPLPPFDKSIIKLSPKSGDILMFPSWLIHEVSPTEGDSERISIAWNVPGSWEATTSVSMSYPVDLSKYKIRDK